MKLNIDDGHMNETSPCAKPNMPKSCPDKSKGAHFLTCLIKMIFTKRLHRGSNPGPSVYKTDALPLSHRADDNI